MKIDGYYQKNFEDMKGIEQLTFVGNTLKLYSMQDVWDGIEDLPAIQFHIYDL